MSFPRINPVNIVRVGGPPSLTLREKLDATGEPWGGNASPGSPRSPQVFAPRASGDELHISVVAKISDFATLTQVVPLVGSNSSAYIQEDGTPGVRDLAEMAAVDSMKVLLDKTHVHEDGAPVVMFICMKEIGQGSRVTRVAVMLDSNFCLFRVLLPMTVAGNIPLKAGALVTLKEYHVTEAVSCSDQPVRPWLVVIEYNAVLSRAPDDVALFSSDERAILVNRYLVDKVLDLGEMVLSTTLYPGAVVNHNVPPPPSLVKVPTGNSTIAGEIPSEYMLRYGVELSCGWGLVSFQFTQDYKKAMGEGNSISCIPRIIIRNPSSQQALNKCNPAGCDCFRLHKVTDCLGLSFPPEDVTKMGGVAGYDRFASCNYLHWYGVQFPRVDGASGTCLYLNNRITDHVRRNQGL